MKNRKTIILVCIVCGVVLIPIFLLAAYQAASEQARDAQAHTIVHLIAISIGSFRENEGRNPKSLDELISSNYWGEAGKRSLPEVVGTTNKNVWHDNDWHDDYSYTLLTNGFSIDVRSVEPVGTHWLGKPRKPFKYSEIDGKPVDFDSH